MPELAPFVIRTALGFVIGTALGFVARRWRFCTLGAIEDAVYGDDTRRLRAWLLAAAVAIAGVHLLELHAGLDLSRSIYAGPRIEWGGAVIGGVMFGFGMALAGTCGFGILLRLGGGDLKALVVFLVMAMAAMMTMRGVVGAVRIPLTMPLTHDLSGSSQRLPEILGVKGSWTALTGLSIAALGALLAVAHHGIVRSPRLIIAGLAIGACIVAGWWATGIAGFDSFDTRRVESFSFVAPLGETALYVMLSSGLRPDFPVGAVLGVIAGAFIAACSGRQFRWEAPDDAREMRRHVIGAFLMGCGGIAALGCTIGQGITGVSTLSVGSLLAIASMFLGARLGLYWLVER
jgi:uncharacterized membrane protein YedE/YeeE